MALLEGVAEVHRDRLDARQRRPELAALKRVHRLVGREIDLDRAPQRQLGEGLVAARGRGARRLERAQPLVLRRRLPYRQIERAVAGAQRQDHRLRRRPGDRPIAGRERDPDAMPGGEGVGDVVELHLDPVERARLERLRALRDRRGGSDSAGRRSRASRCRRAGRRSGAPRAGRSARRPRDRARPTGAPRISVRAASGAVSNVSERPSSGR